MEFFIVGVGAGYFGYDATPLKPENLWQRPDERHYGRTLSKIEDLLSIPVANIEPFKRHFVQDIKTEVFYDPDVPIGDYSPWDKGFLDPGYWIRTVPLPPKKTKYIRSLKIVSSEWEEFNGRFQFYFSRPELSGVSVVTVIPKIDSQQILDQAGLKQEVIIAFSFDGTTSAILTCDTRPTQAVYVQFVFQYCEEINLNSGDGELGGGGGLEGGGGGPIM